MDSHSYLIGKTDINADGLSHNKKVLVVCDGVGGSGNDILLDKLTNKLSLYVSKNVRWRLKKKR